MTAIAIAIRNKSLQWWQWAKLIGAVSLVGLLVAFVSGISVPSFAIGLIMHLSCDFAFQSSETAGRKGERGRHLVVHSLIAGGLVGLLTGLSVSLWAGIGGMIIGTMSHYGIDYSRKFGLANWKLGVALDQLAHLGAILAITLF
jgi:hypothetical protein